MCKEFLLSELYINTSGIQSYHCKTWLWSVCTWYFQLSDGVILPLGFSVLKAALKHLFLWQNQRKSLWEIWNHSNLKQLKLKPDLNLSNKDLIIFVAYIGTLGLVAWWWFCSVNRLHWIVDAHPWVFTSTVTLKHSLFMQLKMSSGKYALMKNKEIEI